MFKTFNISLIYRLIALIILLFAIWFIDNFYVLLGLYLLLFVLNYKSNPLLFFMCIITLLFMIFKFNNSDSFKILNVVLIVDYIVCFIIHIKKEDIKNMKKMFFHEHYTYRGLSKEFFNEIKKENNKELSDFIKNNNLEDDDNINEIKGRMQSKHQVDTFDKLCLNYIRFYKNQNDLNKYGGLNQGTIVYLGIHIIVLILAVVI